jgi:hypothetical protein
LSLNPDFPEFPESFKTWSILKLSGEKSSFLPPCFFSVWCVLLAVCSTWSLNAAVSMVLAEMWSLNLSFQWYLQHVDARTDHVAW